MNSVKIQITAVIILAAILVLPKTDGITYAQSTEDEAMENAEQSISEQQKEIETLKQRIADKNAEIQKIEEEINLYKKQIEETGKETSTLLGAIKKLEATKAKLSGDIRLTENKIQTANLNIERLGLSIEGKIEQINRNIRSLGSAIRKTDELDLTSPVETILANQNLSDGWQDLDNLEKFQASIKIQLDELKLLKRELELNKKESETQKKNLVSLKYQLSDQQKIVNQNKIEKDRLLKETKNKESEYKKILTDRLAQKEQLEREILEFEAELKIDVDISLLPKAVSGVLSWPLSLVKVTQYFGKTLFATSNPQVYNGMGHNGVDFSAAPGTAVKAAEDGVVTDTGDTDKQCYGVSYGKWILLKHTNGLSTLYAHLSLIKVNPGEGILKGDVIGYSGNTGYSTGPHLHFAVFATQAVHVSGPTEYKSKVCKTYMKLPVAPKNGYLNPLSYL